MIPHNVNKTAYFAVTTFTGYDAQYKFLAQYGYTKTEIPNLLRAASKFFKLQQHNIGLNSTPHKPKQTHTPHHTKK